MAGLDELHQAVGDALRARGVEDRVKAQLRAEVFRVLEEQETPPPRPDGDTALVNELIREFLDFHGYRHTLSVLLPEAGQTKAEPLPRAVMADDLGLRDLPRAAPAGKPVPLLYALVQQARRRREAADADQ